MVYSRAECVFILKNYFASKSFLAVREAFSNAHPDNEVPNKTTVHRLVKRFRRVLAFENVVDIFSFYCKAVM
jgi:hypothetical protein